MPTILSQMASPILILMVLLVIGFTLARSGVFHESINKSLGYLLLRITLPSLILVSMQRSFTPELASLGWTVLALSIGVYALYGLLAWILPPLLRLPRKDRGLHRFVIMFSNVGFMGFPIVEALWGRESLFLVAIFNIPFNLLVFTLGISLLVRDLGPRERLAPASFATNASPWPLLREILGNPSLWATVVGFLLFLASWRLPELLNRTLETVGGLTTPLSMILIGSLLAGASVRQVFRNRILWELSFIKLLLTPLVVWGLLGLMALPQEAVRIAVAISAMPAAANTALLAGEFADRGLEGGKIVFLSTLVSFLTIPIIFFLLGMI